MTEHFCIKLKSYSSAAWQGAACEGTVDNWHKVQGQELVVDEDAAAIEAEPPRQLAPFPQLPAAPGLLPLTIVCTKSMWSCIAMFCLT